MAYPTVLEYARHFGLALDHRLNLFHELHRAFTHSRYEHAFDEFENVGSGDTATLEKYPDLSDLGEIEGEQPQLTIEESHQLAQAISKPSATSLLDDPLFWKEILPDHKRRRSLKLKEPLILIGNGDVRGDVQRVKKGLNLDAVLRDICRPCTATDAHMSTKQKLDIDISSYEHDRAALDVTTQTTQEKPKVTRKCIERLGQILRDEVDPGYLNELARKYIHLEEPEHTRVLQPDLALEEHLCDVILPSPCLGNTRKHSVPDEGIASTDSSSNKKRRLDEDTTHITECNGLELLAPWQLQEHTLPQQASEPDDAGKNSASQSTAGDGIEAIPPSQTSELSPHRKLNRLSDPAENDLRRELPQSRDTKIASMVKISPAAVPSVLEDTIRSEKDFHLNEELAKFVHLSCASHGAEKESTCALSSTTDIKFIVNEHIDTSSKIHEVVLLPERQAPSSRLLWKQPGLRLLDHTDQDDDHIDVADFDDGIENSECIQVRHPRNSTSQMPSATLSERESPSGALPRPRQEDPALETLVADKIDDLAPETIQKDKNAFRLKVQRLPKIQNLNFSASGSLAAFMDLRGKRFMKPDSMDMRALNELAEDPIQSAREHRLATSLTSADEPVLGHPYTDALPAVELPAQPCLEGPRAIVLNNSILNSNTSLVAFLERNGADRLKIVYRDFRPEDGPPPDIILGPQSCLVLSSVQSLTQRSLPGQRKSVELFPVQERIASLSRKFRTVTLMVSGMKTFDAKAPGVMAINAFCSSLANGLVSTVEPLYVLCGSPGQSKDALHTSTWTTITENAFPSLRLLEAAPHLKAGIVIQDETPCELFLRKIGMNVLSAQIVLSMIHSIQPDSSGKQGLSAINQLIRMTPVQRLSTFGEIIGRNTIQSVSRALDKEKTTDSGFRHERPDLLSIEERMWVSARPARAFDVKQNIVPGLHSSC